MALGNIAAALAELREKRDQLDGAIAVLEKFVNRGGESDPAQKSKVVVRKAMAKAASSPADAPAKPSHKLTCKKCKTKYVSSRANGACPACNPRSVTAKDV